jgi:hypothetical protein
VEVATSGRSEIHSWPGASRFDTCCFDQLIPFGPLSTGSFGTTLFEVFENPGAQIKLTARKADGHREVFEYSFLVPSNASHNYVKGSKGWRASAFSGSFDIDAKTAELTRLIFETDRLPPDTGMCQAEISTDYHFVPIGDGEFLMPRRSQLDTSDTNGGETRSLTEFSGCREYMAESHLRFGDQDASMGSSSTAPQRVSSVPSGVSLTLALIDAIDLGTAAAGDAVSAKVVHSVRARDSEKALVPAESVARGRILEMRHQMKPEKFLVSMRFDTVEINGSVLFLSARLTREIKAEKRAEGLSFQELNFRCRRRLRRSRVVGSCSRQSTEPL